MSTAREAVVRWATTSRPRILFISHGKGGGIQRHVDELAASLAHHAEVLLLQPFGLRYLQLQSAAQPEESLWFHHTHGWTDLVDFLQAVGIDRVHLHHVDGFPSRILELPSQLGRPYDVTLHDHFPACAAYHFAGGDGRFCGAATDCARCFEARPAPWFETVAAWRAAFRPFLAGAARVIAPSRATADLLQRFFPEVPCVVWPHAEAAVARQPAWIRVLVPGALSESKGLAILESCVKDAAARGLPLHFRVAGFLGRPLAGADERHFSFTGEYREGELDALLARERGDALFFPAQSPETFSYTLTAAMRTSLPILATDLGAFPERLQDYPGGDVLAWDSPAASFNDRLVAMATCSTAPQATQQRGDISREQYRDRYLAGLQRTQREARLPEVHPEWLEEPPRPPKDWTDPALLVDAIDCGRRSSVEALRRRLTVTQEEHEWNKLARAEIDRLNRKIDEQHRQDREVQQQLEERVREQAAQLHETRQRQEDAARRLHLMQNSTSWRLTAPLRWAVTRLRRGIR